MNKLELDALISLLDDTDEFVIEQIEEKLVELGPQVIDELEEAWETTLDENHRDNIEHAIAKIYETTIYKDFNHWLTNHSNELIAGAILLARVQYPEIKTNELNARIETIRSGIWLELSQNLTPMERINTFNQVFFNEFGFYGSLENVYDINNNFIHHTLERKTGSPIMLGILYLALAQDLEMPIFAINLPYHFSLAYCKYKRNEKDEFYASRQQDVIFYVNPMSKGLIFGRQDIKNYLERIDIKESEEFYKPIPNKECIYLLLNHLIASHKEQSEKNSSLKIEIYKELKEMFNNFYSDNK